MPPKFLPHYQKKINQALQIFFTNYQLQNPHHAEKKLKEAVEYATLLGGKRIRPILGILCFEAGQNEKTPITKTQALNALIAVELIHAFSLVHDDLPEIDNDPLRRGHPTVWKKYDPPTAILAGDILNTLAFEVLAQNAPDYALRPLTKILAHKSGLNGMGGGQMRDLEMEAQTEPPHEMLLETHRKKTGQLIRAAALMGCILAKTDPKKEQKIDRYAQNLGLAFQIKDDLLDAEGTEKAVGKKIGKDTEKKGFVYFRGIEKTKKDLQNIIQESVALAEEIHAPKLIALAQYVEDRKK
jgi:geranylgeranyl diphosphate synthase type II